MLPLLLLLVVASASAGEHFDPAAKECAMQCQRDSDYAYGTSAMQHNPTEYHILFNKQLWIDENDQSEGRLGSAGTGRNHAEGWMGPDPGFENHFQIVGKVDRKPQTIRVFHKDQLIDIIQDPTTSTGDWWRKSGYPDALTQQNECIWKCLEPTNSTYAPLNIGEQCTVETGLPVTFLDYGHDYARYASPGPSCGYWTLSIRTKWATEIRVERADSGPSDQEDSQKISEELAKIREEAGNNE